MIFQECDLIFVLLGICLPPLSLTLLNGFTLQLPLCHLRHSIFIKCKGHRKMPCHVSISHRAHSAAAFCIVHKMDFSTCRSKSLVSASKVPMRPSMSPLPCSVCRAFRMPKPMLLSYNVYSRHGCAVMHLWLNMAMLAATVLVIRRQEKRYFLQVATGLEPEEMQYLISCNSHVHLIPDSEQQQSPLCTVDGHFPDQLIKALSIKLFSHRTDACLSSLQQE